MDLNLYSFIGATTALHFHLHASDASDQRQALTASTDLQSVCEQLLSAVTGNTTEESFKELLDQHIVTILESIETIRSTQAIRGIDQTLSDLLDAFYKLADQLMGGGGCDLDSAFGADCNHSFSSFTSFTA